MAGDCGGKGWGWEGGPGGPRGRSACRDAGKKKGSA